MTSSSADSMLRVVVTGAGAGLGLACAEAFAARGAELILCDHDGDALTRAAERLRAFSRFCDTIADSSVAVFAAEIEQKFPSIDVLVNAAGQGYVRTLAMSRMARALLPVLRRGSGNRLIVNIAPAGGFHASDDMFPYASSNTAFEHLSEALAEQTKGSSISVLDVQPILVRRVSPSAVSANHLHALQRVDESATAERVASLVAAERPAWRQRPPAFDRRA